MAPVSPISGIITSPNLGSSGLQNMGVISGKYSAGTFFRKWEFPRSSGSVRTSFAAIVHVVALWLVPVSDRNSLNGTKSEPC